MLSAILSKINGPLIWVVIAAVIVVGWMRIDKLNLKLEIEEKENARISANYEALASNYSEFSAKVSKDLKEQKELASAIQDQQRKNRDELVELRNTFNYKGNGAARDMDKIIESKPTLLEKKINDATKKVGAEIESISDYSK